MLSYFRKIRQRLLKTGSLGKYMGYASGEIILVVVGILIALAINGWVSDKKLKQETYAALANLRFDIHISLTQLDTFWTPIEIREREARARMTHFLREDVPVTDSVQFIQDLIYLSTYLTFDPYRTTVENLLNSDGFELIRDDSLKGILLSYISEIDNIHEFDVIHRAFFLELYGRLGSRILDGLLLQDNLVYGPQTLSPWMRVEASTAIDGDRIRREGYLNELLISTGLPLEIKYNAYKGARQDAKDILDRIDKLLE